MQIYRREILKSLVSMTIIAVMVVVLSSRCAHVATPLGGPYDTLPPRVVSIDPPFGTTNFDKKRITITFDEYLLLSNQQSEFYTSPGMDKMPTVTLRNKSVQVDIDSPLDSNRTYALNFGNCITDNNEGNALSGFRYVFSTGDYIDSLLMSGYTVDAYTGDSLGAVYINFYDDATADSLMRLLPSDTLQAFSLDSLSIDTLAVETIIDTLTKEQLVDYDSVLYKVKADVIARSHTNGIFIAENMAGKTYRVYAFKDNNGNRSYDAGVDLVAFSDTTYSPLNMPPFDIWYDTLRRNLQADPQIYLRLFKEEFVSSNIKSNLSGITRPDRQRLYLTFTGANPPIESITFDSIPSESIITEYLTKGKDTLSLWINMLPESMPDSVAGSLIYNKYDSLNVLRPDTVKFNLGWREYISRKEEREQQRQEDESTEPEIVKLDANIKISGSKHICEDDISIGFSMPLSTMDSSQMILYHISPKDESESAVAMQIVQDSLDIKRWWLSADWINDDSYRLHIPPEALIDISGVANDTINYKFTIDSPDNYSTLLFNISAEDPEQEYIVQVLSSSNSVLKERVGVRRGELKIEYITVGDVKVRIFEDNNRNGKWDAGDLRLRRQPERVGQFRNKENGSQVITTKKNWELEFDIDMDSIFAPVTMESMKQGIQQIDTERQKAQNEKQQKK